jgi:hypothetical protein
LLHSNDSAPKIKNLDGEFNFSNDVLVATQRNLERSGAAMPNFKNLGHSLQKELYGNGRNIHWAFKPIESPVFYDNDENDLQPRVRTFGKSVPEPLTADIYDSDSESRTSSSDEQDEVPILQTLQFLGKHTHKQFYFA